MAGVVASRCVRSLKGDGRSKKCSSTESPIKRSARRTLGIEVCDHLSGVAFRSISKSTLGADKISESRIDTAVQINRFSGHLSNHIASRVPLCHGFAGEANCAVIPAKWKTFRCREPKIGRGWTAGSVGQLIRMNTKRPGAIAGVSRPHSCLLFVEHWRLRVVHGDNMVD